MKKTIEYLILGSFILTLIAGISFRLLDINKTVQIMLFLLAAALLIIFMNLKVILILHKYGLDFYLRRGEDKLYFQYRFFTCSLSVLLACLVGLVDITFVFYIFAFMFIFLLVILPAVVRLLYGDGNGQAGEVISIVLGILVVLVFLVIDLVRK